MKPKIKPVKRGKVRRISKDGKVLQLGGRTRETQEDCQWYIDNIYCNEYISFFKRQAK